MEFAGLKREDQGSIFNHSFECKVSPVLKKAPGKWGGGKMHAGVQSQLQLLNCALAVVRSLRTLG